MACSGTALLYFYSGVRLENDEKRRSGNIRNGYLWNTGLGKHETAHVDVSYLISSHALQGEDQHRSSVAKKFHIEKVRVVK
jgi:hypothetical protein